MGDPSMYTLRPFQWADRSASVVLATATLLAICIGLAVTLVWARGLGDPVRIDGWSVIFRPPKGWQGDPPVAGHYGTMIRFREPTPGRPGRRVVFSQRPNRHNLPPHEFCRDLATSHPGARGLADWVLVEQVPFGPLPGARISLPTGACIHAGVLARPNRAGETYALELLSNQPLKPQDMQLCEAMGRAIRLAD